jgi:UDP-glucuronate decarboxylase
MKNIVVTGGCGFIGSNLINVLIDTDAHIFCIDNLITGSMKNIEKHLLKSNFMFINWNICDDNIEITEQIDEIYHLAGIASPEKYKQYPLETFRTSINGTENMLKICKKYNSRMIFTSTSEIYGDPLVHPQVESYYGNVNVAGDRSCYDEGKRGAETLIHMYKQMYGVNVGILRLFNTYGPNMALDDGRVITNFITNIKKDNPLLIYGDGSQTRSFCFIDDMVVGIINYMNCESQTTINIGNPSEETTILELVQLFSSIYNKEILFDAIKTDKDDPKMRQPDITLAKQIIGFECKTELSDGLLKTIQSYN